MPSRIMSVDKTTVTTTSVVLAQPKGRKTSNTRRDNVSLFRGDNGVSEEEVEELFETNWELEVNKFDDMGLKE